MRKAPGAAARRSRISSFASRAAESTASGAAQSTSRKFATLGQIFVKQRFVASADRSRSRSARTCATRSRCTTT
jgi:hypothetical protein